MELISLPSDIRPKLTGYKVDILLWGIRNLKTLHMIQISKPKITLDFTMETVESDILNRNELNFHDQKKTMILVSYTSKRYL